MGRARAILLAGPHSVKDRDLPSKNALTGTASHFSSLAARAPRNDRACAFLLARCACSSKWASAFTCFLLPAGVGVPVSQYVDRTTRVLYGVQEVHALAMVLSYLPTPRLRLRNVNSKSAVALAGRSSPG